MTFLDQVSKLPPATHVLRPERDEHPPGSLEKISRKFTGRFVRLLRERKSGFSGFLSRVDRHGKEIEGIKERRLAEITEELKTRIHLEGLKKQHIAHAFAIIREMASRTVGMRHFDVQLVGGLVLLRGMVAEMETGEGKTLTATLAAGTAAMAGIPVHVITVNDYLTSRDAQEMGPIYESLGLKVGCITHEVPPESRRAHYGQDITYCTNKEIAFDYLRDWIALGTRLNPLRLQTEYLHGQGSRVHRLVLRGLHFGIVDEADSILIDEARTPLIISKAKGSGDEKVFMEQAMEISESLEEGKDYRVDEAARKVKLLDRGKVRIQDLAKPLGPLWTGTVRRDETVRLALTARHLFKLDEQYLVRDDKVQIIDEFTGRVMPDRSYEQGLQQLIEVKEGCEVTQQPETMARISYQRFFKRYLHLAGMTGTAREVRGELYSVYGLPVVRIPTNKKMMRKGFSDKIFSLEDEKWRSVVDRIQKMNGQGRPILVGTRSVAASESASRLLAERGLDHLVLNARQDKEEADIVAKAGERGSITIATNMAGRGTDIKLGPGVKERGGLHVILTERHEAGRIDRQLAGRCGRQGDPGSYEAILSLQDPILVGGRAGATGWLLKKMSSPGSKVWRRLAMRTILKSQKRVERYHARIRKTLLQQDEKRGDLLSFSGRSE